MAKINFLALGGQDERDKSCFVVEVNDEIFVFNAGVKLPPNDISGINAIIADFSYLEANAKKIKGIFVATPSFANVTGLRLLLSQINPKTPIYTSSIGAGIIKRVFDQKSHIKKVEPNIIELEPIKDKKVGSIFATAFKITNSLPHSYGYVLKTEDGAIVYIDEFIISNDRNKTFDSQINFLNSITKNNTLALIIGTGQSGLNAYTAPSHKNKSFYEDILNKANQRLIVACDSSDAYSIFTLATIAKQQTKPFIIYSNNFINVFSSVIKQGLYNNKNLMSTPIAEMNKLEKAIIVIADNPDNLFNRLKKIIGGEDKLLTINPNDYFVLGFPVIAGIEMLVANLCDELGRKDIDFSLLPKDYLRMVQSDEDCKHVVNLLQPRYVIPINGLYKQEVKFTQAVTSSWIKNEQVISLDNGEQVFVEDKNLLPKRNRVPIEEKFLSMYNALDVGSGVIYERLQMSENGVVSISFIFDKQCQKLLNSVQFKYYGVVNNGPFSLSKVEEIEATFKERMGECLFYDKNKKLDIKETKAALKRLLARLFEKKFNKRPLVLSNFIDYTTIK